MSCSMLIGQQDNSRAVSSSITGSRRCMQMLDYLHINKIQLKIKCSIYILYILVITHANIHTYTVRIGNPLITDNTCASRARAGSKFSMSRAAPATGVALYYVLCIMYLVKPATGQVAQLQWQSSDHMHTHSHTYIHTGRLTSGHCICTTHI